MLKNRFGRLLLTILLVAVLCGILYILSTTLADKIIPNAHFVNNNLLVEFEIPNVLLYQSLFLCACVCIVGQLCGDIMNVKGLLNNGFVTFLKRVIFFAVSALAVFAGAYGLYWDLLDFGKITLLERALCLFTMYAPAVAYLAYLLIYAICTKKGWISENKKSFPFVLLVCYVVAFALSLLTAWLMTERMDWLQAQEGIGHQSYSNWNDLMCYVAAGLYVVGIVLCIVTKNWPFEELGDVNAHDMSYYNDAAIRTDNFAPLYSCKDCAYFGRWCDEYGLYHFTCSRYGLEVGEYDATCFDFVKKGDK